jgi:cytochrome c oxidase subunit II
VAGKTGLSAVILLTAVAFGGAVTRADDGVAQQNEPASRSEWTVVARRYAFTPSRIEVKYGDCVKITLRTEDIAHSFTIDEYRISKRIGPGRPVCIEFRADRRGRFTFYCNLTADEGCRHMRGTLIVR